MYSSFPVLRIGIDQCCLQIRGGMSLGGFDSRRFSNVVYFVNGSRIFSPILYFNVFLESRSGGLFNCESTQGGFKIADIALFAPSPS